MPGHSTSPWLSREGTFRFELGLRQGDEDFFKASSAAPNTLTARAAVLDAHPLRHAAMLDEGAELLERTAAFARDVAGVTMSDASSPTDQCLDLGRRWEPDFLLLKPGSDSAHRLVGGCVCFPSSWDLPEKLGSTIDVIHGPVPTLNRELGKQIDSFLNRLRPGSVWKRWNWGVAAVSDWNHHPALHHPSPHADSTLETSWLRIEHQAFRALDAEGGILFAIRISVESLSDIARHRDSASRLADLLESMPEDVAAYKGLQSARAPLAQQLRAAR